MKIVKVVFVILVIISFSISCNKKTIALKTKNELNNETNVLNSYLNESEDKYLQELRKLKLTQNYSYKDIVYLMKNIDAVTLSSVDPFIEAINYKIGKDINLKIGNKLFQPFYITFSFSKPRDYILNYIYADDTIHTTEFLNINKNPLISINIDSKITLKVDTNFIIYDDLYIGSPAQMHSDGYNSIMKLINNNGFKLPADFKFDKNTEYIIFTFVKHKEFDFYAKLVWVIKMAK